MPLTLPVVVDIKGTTHRSNEQQTHRDDVLRDVLGKEDQVSDFQPPFPEETASLRRLCGLTSKFSDNIEQLHRLRKSVSRDSQTTSSRFQYIKELPTPRSWKSRSASLIFGNKIEESFRKSAETHDLISRYNALKYINFPEEKREIKKASRRINRGILLTTSNFQIPALQRKEPSPGCDSALDPGIINGGTNTSSAG